MGNAGRDQIKNEVLLVVGACARPAHGRLARYRPAGSLLGFWEAREFAFPLGGA